MNNVTPGRKGACVWLTGLSGAGKSTTAAALEALMAARGRAVTVLDGDAVRTHLSADLGFSKTDRDTNVRRIGFVAAEIVRHGGIAIVAAVSPYREARDEVRSSLPEGRFVEVFVDAPLAVCEARDVKGLYRRAREGGLTGLTGVDAPYEAPLRPEIVLDGAGRDPGENARSIVDYLTRHGILEAADVPLTLDRLLAHPPRFHHDHDGAPTSWGLSPVALRFIAAEVSAGSRTLETGAGLSTVTFALCRAVHACVVPDRRQIDLITAFCRQQQVPIEGVTFHAGRSEAVLPLLSLRDLDLVLIDGRHAFPAPFIDWYYASSSLKVGGLVVVDDTQLWTGRTLCEFLACEAEWRLEQEMPTTTVFRKLKEGSHGKEWTDQPFVVENSHTVRPVRAAV